MVCKKNNSKIKKVGLTVLFLVVEIVLCFLLIVVANKLLYSADNMDLIIVILFSFVIIAFSLNSGRKIYKSGNINLIKYLLLFVCGGSFCIGVLYIGKSIYAFRYENSYEIYRLSDNFSVKEAKKIKKNIDNIFEKDFDDVFSRDVFIASLYYDAEEEKYILYLDDYYGNYRLKFYVDLFDSEICNIYWEYDEEVLYFVYNGEKTDAFEYYYALYIASELIGEETSGVLSLEDDVLKDVSKYFGETANVIVSYEDLVYDSKNDLFYWKCHATSMDFYGDVDSVYFNIYFEKINEVKNKSVWYYGDSSFDYVKWKINI